MMMMKGIVAGLKILEMVIVSILLTMSWCCARVQRAELIPQLPALLPWITSRKNWQKNYEVLAPCSDSSSCKEFDTTMRRIVLSSTLIKKGIFPFKMKDISVIKSRKSVDPRLSLQPGGKTNFILALPLGGSQNCLLLQATAVYAQYLWLQTCKKGET